MDQRYVNPPIEMPNIMLELEGCNLDKYTIVDKSTIWIRPPIVPIRNNIWECITLITTQRIFWSREQFSRNIASEWIQQLNPSPPTYWKIHISRPIIEIWTNRTYRLTSNSPHVTQTLVFHFHISHTYYSSSPIQWNTSTSHTKETPSLAH